MDNDKVDELIELGTDSESIHRIQDIAAKSMKAAGYGYTLHNACAAALSAFLQEAGINVPTTLGAGKLAKRLKKDRLWKRITVGAQKAGDAGVTFDTGGVSGADHIYLVVQRINDDQMIIADNQSPSKHTRFASGKGGKTPTEYFLRATNEMPDSRHKMIVNEERIDPNNSDVYPSEDEDTNGLTEPFDDLGNSLSSPVKSKIFKTDLGSIGELDFDEFVEQLSKSIAKKLRK